MPAQRKKERKIRAIIEAAKRLIIMGERVTGEALAHFFTDETPEYLEKIWEDLFSNNPDVAKVRLSDRVAVALEKDFEAHQVPVYHKATVIREVHIDR